MLAPEFYEKLDWEDNSFSNDKHDRYSYDITIDSSSITGNKNQSSNILIRNEYYDSISP